MPAPTSEDLRVRIYSDFLETGSIHKTAERFAVSPGTVHNLRKLVEETGSLKHRKLGRPSGGGMLENADRLIEDLTYQVPGITIDEQVKFAQVFCGYEGGRSTWHRKLENMDYTHKVMDRLPAEALKEEAVAVRVQWEWEVKPLLEENMDLVAFLDEFGLTTKMTRTRGWGPRGKRVTNRAPASHFCTQTGIVCIGMHGVIACRLYRESMNGDRYYHFVKNVLIPILPPGTRVVCDNLSSHKTSRVIKLLEDAGMIPCFTPPYSCDLNPAEPCISKIKSGVRKREPRTFEEVRRAVYAEAKRITANECINYIKAAGYVIQSKH